MATRGAVYICVNFLCTCARLAEWSASQDLSAHCPACGFDPDGILLHLLLFLLLVIIRVLILLSYVFGSVYDNGFSSYFEHLFSALRIDLSLWDFSICFEHDD